MKIKYFGYNAFLIEERNKKIAIDPGRHLWIFNLKSLIPEEEWKGITDILVTHGDIDHFDFAVSIAEKTKANVYCGKELQHDFISAGLKNIYSIKAGDSLMKDGLSVEGLSAEHGPLSVKFAGGLMSLSNQLHKGSSGGQEVFLGPMRLQSKNNPMIVKNHGTVTLLFGLIRMEKDNVDFARGSVGYKIKTANKTVVNLGDSFIKKEWENLKPDVLMIPIGGGAVENTMDIKEALNAVRLIKPRLVLPMHYNCSFLFRKNVNPADVHSFKRSVELSGFECRIMESGDQIEI